MKRMRIWFGALGLLLSCTGATTAQERGGPHLQIPQVIERGAEGPVLLLIPCAGCGARSWNQFMNENEDRFRMIAVTLPGYAGGPRPQLPLYTDRTVFQDNAIEQISRLMDERHLEDVVVVGHSFGSIIALRVAAARPDVVQAVVNVDGSPVNPASRAGETLAERLANTQSIVDDNWGVRLQDPEEYRRFNAPSRYLDEAEKVSHHGMFMASDRVAMTHYWRENLLRDRNPEFSALQMPYLDIKALSPRATNPDSILKAHNAANISAGRPKSFQQVVFHQSSHWLHIEFSRTLGTVIEDFIVGRPLSDVGPFRMGHVERAGTGVRDVILMPCLGCDWRAWDHFLERNSERYRMLAVSWPGMGETPLPTVVADPKGTPYFDHLVRALRLLITLEGLERPVIIGHSAAAVLAVRFAAEHPELVGGVVNVDALVSNLDTYGYTPEQRLAWADAEMADVRGLYDSDEAWRDLNAAPTLPDTARGRFYSHMWLTPPREHVFAYWSDWLRTDAGLDLPRLTVPFLAIHALGDDADRAAKKRADLEQRYSMAPAPPGTRVVYIEGAGHSIWEWQPDAFDQVLSDFILGTRADLIHR